MNYTYEVCECLENGDLIIEGHFYNEDEALLCREGMETRGCKVTIFVIDDESNCEDDIVEIIERQSANFGSCPKGYEPFVAKIPIRGNEYGQTTILSIRKRRTIR